jgi:hypothetical protein
MARCGFRQSLIDDCLFFKDTELGKEAVVVHVDDCMHTGPPGTFDSFMKEFKYEVSLAAPLFYILGHTCTFARGMLKMTQTSDIEAMCRSFEISTTKGKRKPMEPKIRAVLLCPAEDPALTKHLEHGSLIGILLYLSFSRPDIAVHVRILSRFVTRVSRGRHKAAKVIAQYLYTTRHRGLVYGANRDEVTSENMLQFYTDADHAGEIDQSRSRTGFLVRLFGDTIEFVSKLQGAATNSTCHAEMKAMAHLARKAEFFRDLLEDFGHKQTEPTRLYSDSENLIKSLTSGKLRSDVIHMRTDFMCIIQRIRKGWITVHHIPGITNPSDLFTKALPSDQHCMHTDFILNDKSFPVTVPTSSPVPDPVEIVNKAKPPNIGPHELIMAAAVQRAMLYNVGK